MRTSMVTRASDGVQFQAVIRKDGRFQYRFTDPGHVIITNNDWVNFHDNGAPLIPFAFDTVSCFVLDDRFHVECRNFAPEQAVLIGQKGYGLPFEFDSQLYPVKV